MKLLSEALGEALALVEKATDRKWEHIDAGLVLHDPDVSVYCGHIATFVEDDDAEAAAASINFLRDHGPAIAAALRAVEGATQADVHRHAHMGPIALVETDSLVGCRVALVPLDAAGSAEGVS